MLKYSNYQVVFQELPNEVTLAINISGCPIKCPDCHSKYLWEDNGTEITPMELDNLINSNNGITAICFMGGDANPLEIRLMAEYIKKEFNDLKVGWYSGADSIHKEVKNQLKYFDYIKIGPYNEENGALNNPNTNQKMYKVTTSKNKQILKDITKLFWNETKN